MLRSAMAAFLLILVSGVFSQNVFSLQDPVSSKKFNAEKYSAVRGTPFLINKWLKGSVTTPKGVYQNIELKFNVYDNSLFFNMDDETFELQDNIISFTLKPKSDDSTSFLVYRKGISGADLRDNQFVQVLLDAPTALYKLDVKQLSEMSEINTGIVKTFTNNSKYYLSKNKQIQFIKINRKEILNALSDKQEKLQLYINEKKLSFKKDTDIIELLRYYNSL